MEDIQDYTRTSSDKVLIKRLALYLKPHLKPFIFSLVLMFISLAVDLLPPLLLGALIDIVSSGDMEHAKRWLVIMVVGFLIVLAVANLIAYYQHIILQKIGQTIVKDVRLEVFTHIESLSIGQINQVPVGKLVTRVNNDSNSLNELYTSVFTNLVKDILYILAIMVIILIFSFKLGLIVWILMPLVVGATIFFRKFSRKAYRKVRNNISDINSFLSENLSGIKVTQAFNQEDKKRNEFYKRSKELRNNHITEIILFGIYRPFIYGVSIVAIVLLLNFGIKEVLAGALTAGLLYSLYQYTLNAFEPIQRVADQFNLLQNALSSAEKIFNVLDTKPDIVDEDDAIELETFSGHIEFKDVWFQYISNEWVLKDISFEVLPGDTVAFVGATGSGKSTILNLIVRNYDIQKGQILLDGIDIKKIKRSSIRKHIGQMLQDVFLFNDTIHNNITLNDEEISLEEVVEASNYVGANTFIDKLDDNYSHVVLERGNNFSSGQRQLISFARAIVYKPSLMILDEATANIDSETEHIIQESLEKMMNISTMLIVAHRLSTIQYSDKIIVMHKGEIVEMGTHQQLLRNKDLYYKLYELQYESQKGENINDYQRTITNAA